MLHAFAYCILMDNMLKVWWIYFDNYWKNYLIFVGQMMLRSTNLIVSFFYVEFKYWKFVVRCHYFWKLYVLFQYVSNRCSCSFSSNTRWNCRGSTELTTKSYWKCSGFCKADEYGDGKADNSEKIEGSSTSPTLEARGKTFYFYIYALRGMFQLTWWKYSVWLLE